MRKRGQIVSFYSYKGGVGRSMAVANIGTLLAKSRRETGERILLIDWDLEAPGLYPFFAFASDDPITVAPGLLDYFEAVRDQLEADKHFYSELLESRSRLNELIPIERFIRRDVLGSLDFMTAGRMTPDYRRRVAEFDWSGFWESYPAAIHAFRELLETQYVYTLIDSRTGHSDTSGLCSAVLPEKLVVVFSLNKQNLDGVIEIVERAVAFRRRSDDIRPLAVFPLASRVEDAELKERETWMMRFENAFEKCFRHIYNAPECNLTKYFRDIFIRNAPYFSYGEKLVLLTGVEESRAGSLRRAYEDFAEFLIRFDYPWQDAAEAERNRQTEVE